MKKAVLLAVLALALAAPVRAATTQITTSTSRVAAHFQSYDAEGCVLTSTHIVGNTSATATNGGPTTILTGAHVDITQYDTCIGSLLYFVDGETDSAVFTVSEDGSSASLDVLIHATERLLIGAVDVTVSASW